jgi:hypothetical protein
MTDIPVTATTLSTLKLRKVAVWQGVRVLAWHGDTLYGCRGYEILRLHFEANARTNSAKSKEWGLVARFDPVWWRSLTSRLRLSSRLVRDGFHALAILDDRTMVGAVPGAIVRCAAGSEEFQVTHQIRRGTRPLHIASVPSGAVYWGEYFDNRDRGEVHIYVSSDRGRHWQIAYTFPAGSVRHVHNLIYDRWGDCLWILTGDDGSECQVLRAQCDPRSNGQLLRVEAVIAGNQQTRAVAAIPTSEGLYLSTDTPLEANHIYQLDRAGNAKRVGDLASSSIYGCRVGESIFFSTMVEPSVANTSGEVQIVGSRSGSMVETQWPVLARWKKDKLSMRYFQYGNAFLPDGENSTRYLAATTIAVEEYDLVTTLWEVE